MPWLLVYMASRGNCLAAPAGLPRVAGLRAVLGLVRLDQSVLALTRLASSSRWPPLGRLPQTRRRSALGGGAARCRGLAAVPPARVPHADPAPRRAHERARGRRVLVAAAAFAQLIATPRPRRRAVLGSTVLALAAALVGALAVTAGMERGVVSILRWALASAVVLVPALVLAAQLRRDAGRLTGSSRLATVLRAGDIAVLATLPAVALAPLAALTSTPFLQPLVVWLAVVGITRVVAVLPVVREAAREARDRSLVVDEGESSARIAADIHDDVIQDLSMLVHRLTAGEDEAAATLRAAIDRLRAICADLRLPVIHDLGSRALEALVSEVRVASGSTSTSSTTGGAAALRRRARALPHRAGGRGQRRQARSPADRGAPPRRDGPGRARGR